MHKPNLIHVPANYAVEIVIKFDPVNGQTEMQVRNRGTLAVSMWKIVGLLAEHTAGLVEKLIVTPNTVTAPDKENGNA